MDQLLPPVDPTDLSRPGLGPRRERIVRMVSGWIADRTLPPGTRLPPVRDAAAHFQVDKGTMVRAYRLLRERGLVSSVGRSTRATLIVPGSVATTTMRRTLAVISDTRSADLMVRPQPGRMLAIAYEVLAAAQEAGWSVLFQHSDEWAQAGALPTAVVITSPIRGADHLIDRLLAAQVPVTAYGDLIARTDVDRVTCDHAGGVRLLVERLAALGRRRIALHLPRQDLPWMQARLAGYRAAMAAAGLPAEAPLQAQMQAVWSGTPSDHPGRIRALAGELVECLTGERPIDALLGVSDGEAMHLGAAIRLFHRRVHEDVAVCGFDNYWAYSDERTRLNLPAPLLTIDKDNGRIGRALVELATARALGSLPPGPQERVIAPHLIEATPAS